MDRGEWLVRLDLLHQRSRSGDPLDPGERDWYLKARGSLLREGTAEQNAALAGGERIRNHLRLQRAIPVTLRVGGWTRHTTTVDLGGGGLAALVADPPSVFSPIHVAIALPDGELLIDSGSVVGSVPQGKLYRLAVSFGPVPAAVVSRIEDFLLDELLPKLDFWNTVLNKLSL